MNDTAIEIRPEGFASLTRHGRLYKREPSSDGSYRWLKRRFNGWKAVSDRRARRCERLYRHPEDVKPFRRFPRRTAEDVAFFQTSYRIVELETQAREWIGRGREANKELGRIFTRLKALVGHGKFEAYYDLKFGKHSGIPFRTCQAYMKLARQEDEKTKSADSAQFGDATDPKAKAIDRATDAAAAKVAAAVVNGAEDQDRQKTATRKPRIRRDGIYRLPLHMTGKEKNATDQLVKSDDWPSAEAWLLKMLRTLHEKYDVAVGASDGQESSGEGSSDEDTAS